MNPKQGLSKKASSDSMSKWTLPSPQSYTPETAPAKPKGGSGGGKYANKHANSPGGTNGLVGGIKSRY